MKCTLKTLSLISLLAVSLLANVAWAQNGSSQLVNVFFTNQSNEAAKVEWVNGTSRRYYLTVPPGETRTLQTYIGHQWSFTGSQAGMGGPVTQANQVYTLRGQAPAPQPFPQPQPYPQPYPQPVPQPFPQPQPYPQPNPQPMPQPQPATSAVNQGVVNYARSVVGQRLGNGQCTELAVAALRAAGARPGQGYNWGTRVNGVANVQPGDIMQLSSATFQSSYGFGSKWTGPHHTAIVVSVQGNVVQVLEQNINNSPVSAGDYDLSNMTAGQVEFFRPVAGNGGRGQGNPNAGNRPNRGMPVQPIHYHNNENPWIHLIHSILD